MSSNSSVFVEVDDYEKESNVRRTRSNGSLDFLQEQERWDRRDRELQMIRYRDRGYHGTSHQRAGADRLAVPIYEVSPRRPRARSDTRSPYDGNELSRSFKTLEVRPEPRPVGGRESSSEPVVPDIRHERGSNHSRHPIFERANVKIPPVVIQEHPPASKTMDQRPGRSPSASPRSPSGQPQLQYKYLLLQNKLADISLACVRYVDVEAASPRDLTFAKISEQVKGFAFELQVWSHISNIQNMARSDLPEDAMAVVDAASRNMERLIDRAMELHDACLEAKPNDLKFEGLAKVEDEDVLFGKTDDDQSEQDPTESLGYIIDSGLHSIKLQIKNLKRLTHTLQESTPDAKDEVVAVSSLVGEAIRYFGSENALNRFSVDKKLAGRRALEEARYAAAR